MVVRNVDVVDAFRWCVFMGDDPDPGCGLNDDIGDDDGFVDGAGIRLRLLELFFDDGGAFDE